MNGPALASRRLKVLVLDEGVPYPPNAGKSYRTWNLLRRLAGRHDVCMLCYGHPSDPAASKMRAVGIDLRLVEPLGNPRGAGLYFRLFLNLFSLFPFSVSKHYSRAFQARLDKILQEDSWDLIQCEWTPYARFVGQRRDVPILITTHNVESQIWARRAEHAKNPFAKAFFRSQEWKMHRFEKRALLRASATTVVSNLERSALLEWGVINVDLVPNGVDLVESAAQTSERETENELLFLASLDWYPNLDALDYFVKNIFPSVRKIRPTIKLRIVGRKPSESVVSRYSHLPGIDFVGEVEEVASYMHRATVVVVPLRIGGGSRIKILEALAARKAIVSTSIGAEGLDVISREHLLIADSPRAFADGIEELLASSDLRRRLGQNGFELVSGRYTWEEIAGRLESVWYHVSQNRTETQRNYFSPVGFEATQ